METNQLIKHIEALLFYFGEPVSVSMLAKTLGADSKNVREGIAMLEEKLSDRGIVLMQNDDMVSLATYPGAQGLIEKLAKEELDAPLTKAALETLTIILYEGPITKSDIDFVRGVNSHYILRALLVRGLIERISNPKDSRSYLYRPTMDLLSHMGITKTSELPEYEDHKREIHTLITQADETPEENKGNGENE